MFSKIRGPKIWEEIYVGSLQQPKNETVQRNSDLQLHTLSDGWLIPFLTNARPVFPTVLDRKG